MRALTDNSVEAIVSNSSNESSNSLIKQLLNFEYLTGALPFVQGGHCDDARPGVKKSMTKDIPGEIIRETAAEDSRIIVLEGPDKAYYIYASYQYNGYSCTVYGRNREQVAELTKRCMFRVKRRQSSDPNKARMAFWYMSGEGPEHNYRDIDIRPWDVIARNYSKRVQPDLCDLMTTTADTVSGKMLLFYGPPGTGKTTLIRSLASEWRKWCDFHIIMDPDVMLNNGSYITQAVLSESQKPWKMIVLEDCGELIEDRPANAGSNQGLARLLNLTDGILGQGKNILMCITTNEPVAKLNPAVMRAGRCLANLEIPPSRRRKPSSGLAGLSRTLRGIRHWVT